MHSSSKLASLLRLTHAPENLWGTREVQEIGLSCLIRPTLTQEPSLERVGPLIFLLERTIFKSCKVKAWVKVAELHVTDLWWSGHLWHLHFPLSSTQDGTISHKSYLGSFLPPQPLLSSSTSLTSQPQLKAEHNPRCRQFSFKLYLKHLSSHILHNTKNSEDKLVFLVCSYLILHWAKLHVDKAHI